jgi:hypothetical protein
MFAAVNVTDFGFSTWTVMCRENLRYAARLLLPNEILRGNLRICEHLDMVRAIPSQVRDLLSRDTFSGDHAAVRRAIDHW